MQPLPDDTAFTLWTKEYKGRLTIYGSFACGLRCLLNKQITSDNLAFWFNLEGPTYSRRHESLRWEARYGYGYIDYFVR